MMGNDAFVLFGLLSVGVAGGLRQNSEIAGALKVAGSAARLAVQRVALIGSGTCRSDAALQLVCCGAD
jgi:hypothetical protein